MGIRLKKLISALFVVSFFSIAVFGKEVTVQIVQHGGNNGAIGETAMTLEDEILNSFFDAGHIVTNLPAAMSYSRDDDTYLIEKLFSESASGGGDYAIQVRVYLDRKTSTSPDKFKLSDISKVEWNITTVKSGKNTIGAIEGPTGKKSGVDDSIRTYAATVAARIVKSL